MFLPSSGAPRAVNSSTIGRCPLPAAQCRPDIPELSAAAGSTPCARRSSTTSVRPYRHAHTYARSTCDRGSLESPSLSIQSNLGDAVAESFKRELGAEIEAAEQRVRQEVDQRIQPVVADARARLDELETGIAERLGVEREQVDALRARLETRIRELSGGSVPQHVRED